MSAIYWHSPSADDVRLSGSERAYMGVTLTEFALAMMHLPDYDYGDTIQRWLRVVDPSHYMATVTDSRRDRWFKDFKTAISVEMGTPVLRLNGKPQSFFLMTLNTVLKLCGPEMRLFARLHGQCELHCWVDGPDRNWLAGVIESGRACSLYRSNVGWEAVVALLRARDDEPVVTSYSVCESFPRPLGTSERARERFWRRTQEQQFKQGMRWLRQVEGIQLEPEELECFGNGLTVLDLRAAIDAPMAAESLTVEGTP